MGGIIVRKELKKLGNEERFRFMAEFARTGFATSFNNSYGNTIYKPTILFKNLVLLPENQYITDHLWFNYGKQFMRLGDLKVGDKVQFDARVATYQKGWYLSKTTDFKLTRPTKVKLISNDKRPAIPMEKQALLGKIWLDNLDFYQANMRELEGKSFYIDKYKEWLKNNDK